MSLALRQVHFIENYHSGVLDLEQEVSERIAGISLPVKKGLNWLCWGI